MNQKELKELIEFLIEKDIAEFELERGDVKVRIKRAAEPSTPAHDTRFIAVHAAPPPTPELGAVPAVTSPSPTSAASKKVYQPPRKACTWCVRPSWERTTSRLRQVRHLL